MRHFKRMFCLIIVGLLALGAIANAQEEKTIKLMTYNLKFASTTFKPAWKVRRDWQVDLINKYSPGDLHNV